MMDRTSPTERGPRGALPGGNRRGEQLPLEAHPACHAGITTACIDDARAASRRSGSKTAPCRAAHVPVRAADHNTVGIDESGGPMRAEPSAPYADPAQSTVLTPVPQKRGNPPVAPLRRRQRQEERQPGAGRPVGGIGVIRDGNRLPACGGSAASHSSMPAWTRKTVLEQREGARREHDYRQCFGGRGFRHRRRPACEQLNALPPPRRAPRACSASSAGARIQAAIPGIAAFKPRNDEPGPVHQDIPMNGIGVASADGGGVRFSGRMLTSDIGRDGPGSPSFITGGPPDVGASRPGDFFLCVLTVLHEIAAGDASSTVRLRISAVARRPPRRAVPIRRSESPSPASRTASDRAAASPGTRA